MGTADSSIDFYKTLAQSPRVILPSLLACNFANLERDIRELEKAGVQGLHLDVMDGHFVPNLSIGVPVVEAVRRVTDLVLDVHLMLSDPEFYFEPFRKAGADGITFHIEAIADQEDPGHNYARTGCQPEDLADVKFLFETHVHSALEKVHRLGAAAGLSLIPPSDVTLLKPFLSECENALVMSVMPGFGGQKFDPRGKEKLAWLRENGPAEMLRSVDGGVNETTVMDCKLSGGTGLVMGTAIFRGNQIQERFQMLNKALQE